MFCRAFGLCRRSTGAFLLLLLLVCGVEIALRLSELLSRQALSGRSSSARRQQLTTPSWTTFQELRPLASLSVTPANRESTHLVRFNSFGLRGEEVLVPKPPEVVRILCLGDESLLGLRIPDEALFTTFLQDRLQAATQLSVEVCNAGVPGACPLTEYLLLMHRLAALQPDLVIATLELHDLAEDHAYRRFTRLDESGMPLACRHPSLGGKTRTHQLTAWREQFRLVDLGLRWAGDTWKQQTDASNGYEVDGSLSDLARLQSDSSAVERTLQPFTALARWCQASAVQLCVIEVADADSTGEAASPHDELSSALQALAESEQFFTVRVMRQPHENGSSKRTTWTSKEHREFADRVAGHVAESIPGPWNSPYFRRETPISPASLEKLNPGPTGRRPSASIRHP